MAHIAIEMSNAFRFRKKARPNTRGLPGYFATLRHVNSR